MKKWAIVAIVCILVAVSFFVDAYFDAMSVKKEIEQRAVARAVAEGISRVTKVDTYRGRETYVVVIGENEQQKQIIMWITEDGQIAATREGKDGITREQALSLVRQYEPKEILSVKLGLEQGVPLWEITYIDKQNRYSFYYVRFDDGVFLKRYHFIS